MSQDDFFPELDSEGKASLVITPETGTYEYSASIGAVKLKSVFSLRVYGEPDNSGGMTAYPEGRKYALQGETSPVFFPEYSVIRVVNLPMGYSDPAKESTPDTRSLSFLKSPQSSMPVVIMKQPAAGGKRPAADTAPNPPTGRRFRLKTVTTKGEGLACDSDWAAIRALIYEGHGG